MNYTIANFSQFETFLAVYLVNYSQILLQMIDANNASINSSDFSAVIDSTNVSSTNGILNFTPTQNLTQVAVMCHNVTVASKQVNYTPSA
jgi:hypothetical protein